MNNITWSISNGIQTGIKTKAGDCVIVSTVHLFDSTYETIVLEGDFEKGEIVDFSKEYDVCKYYSKEKADKNHWVVVDYWANETRELKDIPE